ncbi:MAG: MFS transporter [Polyangiales bacterium]
MATETLAAPYPARWLAWYATVLLAVLYWLSILDRFIISLLVDPIKRDLGISDLQFGMLHGFAFAGTFALFGLALGTLADRVSRRWVIFAGVSVWSLATAACGFAQSFWHLMLARVGVGAGEATLNPCATSMLTDLFPRERLSFAMAIYAMGSTIGGGTAYLIGGAIADLTAHSDVFRLPLLGEVRSWQAVFLLVGIPGGLISLAIFTVPEPVRRGLREHTTWSSSYGEMWRFIRSRPTFFFCHYVGFALSLIVVTGGGSWYPMHMKRAFGWTPGQIGLYLGLTVITAAIVGKSIAGRVMDRMYARGYRDAQLRWYLGALLAAVPTGWFAFHSTNPWACLAGLGLYSALLQPYPVCAFTSLNLVTPAHLRGTGVAFFGATAGLVGAGLGPILVPAAARLLSPSADGLGTGLATVAAIGCPLAAIALGFGLKSMREAVAAAEI